MGMRIVCIFFMLGIFLFPALSSAGLLSLPPLPSPEEYGNVLMNWSIKGKNVGPVLFSHWTHRVKYTCRVCHYELEFSMKANDTPIECDKGKMGGRYCSACHNGKISFAAQGEGEAGENCDRCHSGSGGTWQKFSELQAKLPKSKFGNGIDWSKALNEGFIKPKDSLSGNSRQLANINKTLTLSADMAGISSAVFPHVTHEKWLDCSSCHPELFNIKKKTTESMRMRNMLKGESCGVCHLFVAFPLNDCKKCHPKMSIIAPVP
jgi:c(7)-type cytochrome triheme protein